MELRKTILKNTNSRILLERADNGVILSEISEDNTVSSKIVYEIYYSDGLVDLFCVEEFVLDMLEHLKIPTEEPTTNAMLSMEIGKIDESLPGIIDEEDDDDDETDD
jgi:hypothetical protein